MGYEKLVCCILSVVVSYCVMACEIRRHDCQNEPKRVSVCSDVMVNCSGRNLNQIPMTIPRDTTDLYIANNNLSESSLDRLKYFKTLITLNLGHNKIRKLFPGAFKGLRHLKEIDLRHNPLCLSESCFPKKSFGDLVSLEKLNIIGVYRVARVDQTAPVYPIRSLLGLPAIKHLYLSGGGPNMTFPEEITSLKTLESLEFFDGNILSLNSKIVHHLQYTNINTLSFKYTDTEYIEDGLFSNFTNLRRLGIAGSSHNLLLNNTLKALATTVNSGIDTLLLEDLGDHGNIREDDFCNDFMSKIKTLSIRSNGQLQGTLTSNASKCLSTLEYLAAGYNRLDVRLDPHVINKYILQFSPPKLKICDMSCLFCWTDAYRAKYRNEDMFFDDNFFRISEILTDKTNFSFASAIIPENNIAVYVPPTLEYIFVNDLSLMFGFEDVAVYFQDNNIIFLNASGVKLIKSLDQPLVGLRRLQIIDLSYSGLNDITKEAFIDFPSLRELNLSNNELGNSKKHFQSTFHRLHNLSELDLSANSIETLDDLAFVNLTKLRILKLKNNLLKRLQFSIKYLVSLKLLDISYNQFQTLEKQEIEDLEYLYHETSFRLDITRNPLLCNCEAIPFIKWIQTTTVSVYEKESLICNHDGRREGLMAISVSDIEYKCSSTQRIIMISSIVSSLVLICAVLSTPVVFKYRWQIRWYYYTTKTWFRKARRPQEATPLLGYSEELENYDMYVVYASKHDYQFVTRELRLIVEEEWHKKMFIWERDSLAGGAKQDDIVFYQKRSNKILVYLTPHFIEDKWYLFDVHMAFLRERNEIMIIYTIGTGLDGLAVSVREILNPGSGYNVVEWSDNEYVQNFFWRSLKQFLEDGTE